MLTDWWHCSGSASAGTPSDPNFWAIVDPNQKVAPASTCLGQAFARNPDFFAPPDSGRDGHSQGTVEAADALGTALGRLIGGDPQVAPDVGASNFESGVRTGFDPDCDHTSAKIAFSGNAEPGAGCRSGRNVQGVSLGPFWIGGILDPDIQSSAAQKIVEPQVDVLGQVFLDPGGSGRLFRALGLVQFLIVGFPSIGVTEDLVGCVERLSLFNGIH